MNDYLSLGHRKEHLHHNLGVNVNHRSNEPTFFESYEHLCALQNVAPLQYIKNQVLNGTLEINADKLKICDWEPLLNALKVNKTLTNVIFKSNFNEIEAEYKNNRIMNSRLRKPPAIRNKEKTIKLCKSIRDCLIISPSLQRLEIQGIPLAQKEICILAKGLKANKTLKILSLEECEIGDDGLMIITRSIKGACNLNRVNFSSCNLTSVGAQILATLIKYQALKRHDEAWKDSLRYGRPELDSMFGLRRITINNNPMMGDKAAEHLAEAFKGDLWLKALDMQDCGITTEGATYLLSGLKFNAMLHVLDVRLNPKIDRDMLQKIMEQVMINSNGKDTEYEWMSLISNKMVQPKEQITKIKKRRTTNASFSKKSQFHHTSTTSKLKRCKSTGSVVNTDTSRGGIPWRTAARANRHLTSHSQRYHHDEFDEHDEISRDLENINLHSNGIRNEFMNDFSYHTNDTDRLKNLSVKELIQVIKHEQESKSQLEYKIVQLKQENNQLKNQVNVLQHQVLNVRQTNLNKSILDDDKALEIIELTLHKYQKFLDYLRNNGLGNLIAMGDDINDSRQADETKYDDKSLTSYIDHNPTQNKTLNMSNIDTLVSKSLEISRNYRKNNNSTLMDITAKNNIISNEKNKINQEINQVHSESIDDENEYEDEDDNYDDGEEIELDEDAEEEHFNDND